MLEGGELQGLMASEQVQSMRSEKSSDTVTTGKGLRRRVANENSGESKQHVGRLDTGLSERERKKSSRSRHRGASR